MTLYGDARQPWWWADKDFIHCPYCSRCPDPVGHCHDHDCAPNWHSHADNLTPEQSCACECERCERPWAAKCDEAGDHRVCERCGRED